MVAFDAGDLRNFCIAFSFVAPLAIVSIMNHARTRDAFHPLPRIRDFFYELGMGGDGAYWDNHDYYGRPRFKEDNAPRSSNGRTAAFGAADEDSNPSRGSTTKSTPKKKWRKKKVSYYAGPGSQGNKRRAVMTQLVELIHGTMFDAGGPLSDMDVEDLAQRLGMHQNQASSLRNRNPIGSDIPELIQAAGLDIGIITRDHLGNIREFWPQDNFLDRPVVIPTAEKLDDPLPETIKPTHTTYTPPARVALGATILRKNKNPLLPMSHFTPGTPAADDQGLELPDNMLMRGSEERPAVTRLVNGTLLPTITAPKGLESLGAGVTQPVDITKVRAAVAAASQGEGEENEDHA